MITFRLIALGILLSLCVGVYARVSYLSAENARLSEQLVNANESIELLDEILRKREEIAREEKDLITRIEKEPKSHDAPTAPVLRNAINRLHKSANNE